MYQAQLEHHQGHVQLDNKILYQGAHESLIYDLHNKNGIPHIGINNLSNWKADTKTSGYQETLFFDWKIQMEKVQFTQEVKDDTIFYQGLHLPGKKDQGYSYPTTRTQATIVVFPEDICTTFQVAKVHATMIKFHKKNLYRIYTIGDINPDQTHTSIENQLTRFQFYPEKGSSM